MLQKPENRPGFRKICVAPEGYGQPELFNVHGGVLIMCVDKDLSPIWWDGMRGAWRIINFEYGKRLK